MTRRIIWIWLAVLGIGILLTAQVLAQETTALKTQKEKEAYAIGVDLARNMKRQGVVADPEALARGVRDELSGAKLLMTEEDLRAALNEFQTELKQTRARAVRYVAQENKIKGDAFLAENKAKEGVVTLPSGLQYKIIKEGNGAKPTETDTVEVNYRGTLIDGTEFLNSYRTGKPATIQLKTMTIPGLREALKLMPIGSKWQLFIPSNLAYGEKGHAYGKRGAGPNIGPNETLIFEIELLSIK